MNKLIKISDIARNILKVDTLETRRSDRFDFHEVAVWQIKKALEDAYDVGFSDAKQTIKETTHDDYDYGQNNVEVTVTFSPRDDSDDWKADPTELSLSKVASSFQGEDVASGMGMMGRDIVYEFPSMDQAFQAKSAFEDKLLDLGHSPDSFSVRIE